MFCVGPNADEDAHMLMTAPAGNDSFTGNDGFTYAANAGISVEIGNAAIRQALQRNWAEIPYPLGNGDTRAESFGASPAASASTNTSAINRALTLGGVVTLDRPGTYVLDAAKVVTRVSGLQYQVCLIIPSNTTFRCGPGVVLQAAAGLNNVALIQNSDVSGGNVNIVLEGGTWDGNSVNTTRTDSVSDYACMAMWFQTVVNLKLLGVTMTNPRSWGIGIGACKYVVCRDTRFNYTCPITLNQGGFQFEGAIANARVLNTYGNTYDDMVAFVADVAGFANASMAGPGAVNNILIDGVVSDTALGCWHHVRLQDSVSNPIHNAIIRNIQGPYTDGCIVLSPASGQSTFDNVLIDGVECNPLVSVQPALATIEMTSGATNVTIQNVSRTYSDGTEATKHAVIRLSGSATFTRLKINNLHILDATAAGANTAFISPAAGLTLGDLQVSNVTVQTNLSTSSNLLISNNATIGRVHLSDIQLLRVKTIFSNTGQIAQGVWASNIYSFSNNGVAFIHSGAQVFPIMALTNVRLDSTQGGASGCINVTNVSGTMLIQFSNCSFNNGASANIVRSASEAIRVQGVSVPVPNAILTEAVGDMFADSSNSNNPYRCSVAPSTFVAL
jgi:hypothetical protein